MTKTRPWPLIRLFDYAGANRVAQDVTEDGQKVSILLDGKTLEATLPDVSAAPVAPVISPYMTGEPPLHECAEGHNSLRLKDKVKVVRHQAESKHLDRKSGFRRAQQAEENLIVPGIAENGRTAVSPINDVIGIASQLASWNARHRFTPPLKRGLKKTSLSPFGNKHIFKGKAGKSSLSPFL